MKGHGEKFTVLVVLLVFCASGCSKDEPVGPKKKGLRGDNVLLITVDTTRADRIGCYGYRPARTPAIDALASRGVLFQKAYAQVPLTLPSHSSIMTGRYPREHGVRDNGRETLGRQFPTLASIFQEHGYRTGGFVSAFVLDHRFGIARGFDVYADQMYAEPPDDAPQELQLRANVTTDRALNWLGASPDAPFFCWVHYYDPHDPYDPPAEFVDVERDPYDGEIAFMDSQIGRLVEWLDRQGLRDKTLIVLIGDHGESLGEHDEHGHTNFTYDTNLHIPLIFASGHAGQPGLRSNVLVESVDVLPTVLELFGWKSPDALMSRSLVPILGGGSLADAEVYSETLYVRNGFGWAEQRSLTTSEWKFISSEKPELYDLVKDPGEVNNVIEAHPRVAAELNARLLARFEAMVPGKAEKADLSEAAKAGLAGLGYLDVGETTDGDREQFLTPGLVDPKDMTGVLNEAATAKKLMLRAKGPEDFQEPIRILKRVTKAIPRSLVYHGMLGKAYQGAGQFELSVAALSDAIKVDPTQAGTHLLRARSLLQLQRNEEASAEFRVAIELGAEGPDVRAQFGAALEATGRRREAIEQYRRAVTFAPTLWRVHDKLCKLLGGTDAFAQAVEQLRSAVDKHPDDAFGQFTIGSVLLGAGDRDRAVPYLRSAVKLDPQNGRALIDLGIALRDGGQLSRARPFLERAEAIESVAPQALYNLGILEYKSGHSDRTVSLYEKAIDLKPSFVAAVSELAQFYVQQHRVSDAIRILRKGATASPNEVKLLNALGQLLATAGDASVRDGSAAVELLEKAVALTGRKNAVVLSNLAAAYAESGQFAKAVATAREALRLPAPSTHSDLSAKVRRQLSLYLENRPYHDERL